MYDETFKNVRIRFWKQHTQEALESKPQVSCHSMPPGFWCHLFKHAVLLTGRLETPLYSGQRSM